MGSKFSAAGFPASDELGTGYDVVVAGGGVAGLSGALTLARSRRRVAVIDSGSPRNAPAAGVHNFLTRDGTGPFALLGQGRAEVRSYGAHVVTGEISTLSRNTEGRNTEGRDDDGRDDDGRDDDGRDETGRFTVTLADGRVTRARRLLVTTGLADELPELAGLRERWGRDVVHCPYCHGWEIRDQAIGVLATGPMSVHQALLFRQLSPAVTYFTHTAPAPAGEQAEQLAARDITVVPGPVAALEVTDDQLTGVRLADGAVVPVRALAVSPRMVARGGILASLGLKPAEHPSGMGEYIAAVDPTGRTEVPGVWVAGNVADIAATVPGSAGAGTQAGAHINADLIAEETARAVAARRGAPR
jgi:thioredoxin reductase